MPKVFKTYLNNILIANYFYSVDEFLSHIVGDRETHRLTKG